MSSFSISSGKPRFMDTNDLKEMLAALSLGREVRLIVASDGRSMKGVLRRGYVVTLRGTSEHDEFEVGDLVLVRWKNGHILHRIGRVHDQRFLIVNGSGAVNGWVRRQDLIGVGHVDDPWESDMAAPFREYSQSVPTFVV